MRVETGIRARRVDRRVLTEMVESDMVVMIKRVVVVVVAVGNID